KVSTGCVRPRSETAAAAEKRIAPPADLRVVSETRTGTSCTLVSLLAARGEEEHAEESITHSPGRPLHRRPHEGASRPSALTAICRLGLPAPRPCVAGTERYSWTARCATLAVASATAAVGALCWRQGR